MHNKINVVLYEPEIPQNTGNISRTCSVTGAALHIIKPIGFEISDRTLKRAGLDYWAELEVYYYDSYADFCRMHSDKPIWYFSSHAAHTYAEADFSVGEVWLMFGKESVGLPKEVVLANAERGLRMPMLPGKRCLNLSNSVAIAVYEVLRQRGFASLI